MKLRNKTGPSSQMKTNSTFEATDHFGLMNLDSSRQNTVREQAQGPDELSEEYNGSHHISPAKPSFSPFTYPLRKSRRIKLKINRNTNMN